MSSSYYCPSSDHPSYGSFMQAEQQHRELLSSNAQNVAQIAAANLEAGRITADATRKAGQIVASRVNQMGDKITREIGEMNANMFMGFLGLQEATLESAKLICNKLDSISDTLRQPALTKSRELYKMAHTSFLKGFYKEALDDVNEALKLIKVDYISWFLRGRVRLLGINDSNNTIDLDDAITAFNNAARFIMPDVQTIADAKPLAAEIFFHLGIAAQAKGLELLPTVPKEGEKLLGESAKAFAQAYSLSDKMLEAKWSRTRVLTLCAVMSESWWINCG